MPVRTRSQLLDDDRLPLFNAALHGPSPFGQLHSADIENQCGTGASEPSTIPAIDHYGAYSRERPIPAVNCDQYGANPPGPSADAGVCHQNEPMVGERYRFYRSQPYTPYPEPLTNCPVTVENSHARFTAHADGLYSSHVCDSPSINRDPTKNGDSCCDAPCMFEPPKVEQGSDTGIALGRVVVPPIVMESVPKFTNVATISRDMYYQAKRNDSSQGLESDDEFTEEKLKLEMEELQLRNKMLDFERKRLRASKSRPVQIINGKGMCKTTPTDEKVDEPTLRTFMLGLNLPKLEVETFDGSPKSFFGFMRSFESNVANRVADDGQRLSYLIHYCRGRAREAIEHCNLLPYNQGYTEAIGILSRHFGQPHLIAQAFRQELLVGSKLRYGDLDGLRRLATRMRGCYLTLSQLGKSHEISNSTILLSIVDRLPPGMQDRWAELVDGIMSKGIEPRFEDLLAFIEKRLSVASSEYGMLSSMRLNTSACTAPNTRYARCNASMGTSNHLQLTVHCPLCRSNHDLPECPRFSEQSLDERRNTVKNNKRCFICLRANHIANTCKVYTRCSMPDCGKRHHTLMHFDIPDQESARHSDEVHCTSTYTNFRDIRLGFVPVRLVGPRGAIDTYAFLDNGSDSTLIDKNLAERLGLKLEACRLNISTLHGTRQAKCGQTCLELRSIPDDTCINIDRVFAVERLPINRINKPTVDTTRWSHLAEVKPYSLPSDSIGILLGCDVPEAHWVTDQRIGNRNQPYAVKTQLGWVLWGQMGSNPASTACVNSVGVRELSLKDKVAQMYELEFRDIGPVNKENYSVEDSDAIKMVESSTTHFRGHYTIGLPWRSGKEVLPDNRDMAERRLSSLKRRFANNPQLLHMYIEVMVSHIAKGYVRRVNPRTCSPCKRWYLPHHPVVNPNKPGKVRIVFDCAAVFRGVSLNNCLLQGPDMANKLTGVLLRFRKHVVAVSADIKEMFLQVHVPEQDRSALSFLWWSSGDLSKPPDVYEMNVHPFGATSSPFCANYALRKTACCNERDFRPEVAAIVKENFYVDDCLVSFETVAEARIVVDQLRRMLELGGFQLTKWVSTHKEVLVALPTDSILEAPNLEFKTELNQRALGVQWEIESDCFKFEMHLPVKPQTRRGVLACVASFYDPMGYVAPMLLPARKLLQELCTRSIGWDTVIEKDHSIRWNAWLEGIKTAKEISVTRCIKPCHFEIQEVELHMFSDASEVGYGAVGYLRLSSAVGTYHCSFLMGKSRITPTKPTTIPRLELVAAVLSVKLMRHILDEIKMHIHRVFLWSDSTIVLQYVKNTSTRFATFVANRIGYIREHTTSSQWRHIPSQLNPADVASRGVTCANSAGMRMWLCGPTILINKEDTWPIQPILSQSLSHNDPEVRKPKTTINTISTRHSLDAFLHRYSSWSRLLRATAWLGRFKTYLRNKLKPSVLSNHSGRLTLKEIKDASTDIVRLIQMQVYSDEINALTNTTNKTVSKSTLRTLYPIMLDGLLCVGGRLQNLKDGQFNKHPVILPNNHFVTDLIIREHHETEGHMGIAHILSSIRKGFWIPKGASAIKRIISKCMDCRLRSAKPLSQIMAPLPESRINVSLHPFASVGVDYFGPMIIRDRRCSIKRFGCLFTCLRTRAVHIEVAHFLTTDSFLMALGRFIGRRGPPKEIYCDNGTNFVGAECELRIPKENWEENKISKVMLRHQIDWHFNPPASSHRGGIWERMIRSVRRILTAVAGAQVMTDETLLTYLAEVERVLNNRPLVPIYDDPMSPKALSPSDLLLLRTNDGLDTDETTLRQRYTRAWRQSQHLADVFWKRWSVEYVSNLQMRHKWATPKRDLKVGDLVLVVNEQLTRGCWKRGIVTEAVQSTDGRVRKAIVRTMNGEIVRDIRKICLLEGDD